MVKFLTLLSYTLLWTMKLSQIKWFMMPLSSTTMMSKMLPLLMTTLSLTLIFSNVPISLGIIILMIALSTSVFISLMSSSWMAMIIFLIYIGGLMVLFAYFLATQPNMHIHLIKSSLKSLLIMMTLYEFMPNSMLTSLNKLAQIPSIMAPPNFTIIMLMAAILLLILIIVVKMTMSPKSPLRPFKQ